MFFYTTFFCLVKNNEVREKGFERQWSDQKKSHKKEDVKRKETMRREKKKKKNFTHNIVEMENCVPIGSKYLETNFTQDMIERDRFDMRLKSCCFK